ncbi:MAG: DUF3465 domain-containing protein [Coriobacteriia bacterium]|nr:DUF3465 domain-containing protein [Coriobacteriia bacterium]
MKKLKALILFILAIALAMTLTCCQNNTGNTDKNGSVSSAVTSDSSGGTNAPSVSDATSGADPSNSDAVIKNLYDQQKSNVQVSGSGTVVRLLADDTEGSRHQRFILQLASGQTLLVAHNISIAPRLDGLAVGDTVSFYGEYIYSAEGGTIHWTHHDPQGAHVAGWLEYNGKRYQ